MHSCSQMSNDVDYAQIHMSYYYDTYLKDNK